MATDKRRAENDAQLEKEAVDPSLSTDAGAGATPDKHLVQLPGAQLHLISLTGKAFERTLLWKLDWWHFLYVSSSSSSSSFSVSQVKQNERKRQEKECVRY